MSTTPATTSYTDDQLQTAIDAAFPLAGASYLANLDTSPEASHWPEEAPNRLAIGKAFLAALLKPAEASAEPEQAWANPDNAKAFKEFQTEIEAVWEAKPAADEPAQAEAVSMPTQTPAQCCPHCGMPEVEAMTPRTVYRCGSSDYDRRPGTLKLSEECLRSKAQPTQSQQAWTPRPGDVVRLKSGGLPMTVESVTDFGIAFCSWMTAGSLETRPVAVVMLTPAKEGQP